MLHMHSYAGRQEALAHHPGLFQVKLESQDQMTGDFYTKWTTAAVE